MILFLHGPDTFRSRQNLRDSIVQFKAKRDPQGYNVVFVDGKKETIGKILTEIMSAPFLAERRMIVVENILSSSDKELLSEFIGRIKNKKFPESNIVIFWQGEPLSKVKEAKELQNLLAKEKYAREFALLKGAELTTWARQEIAVRGGQIEQPALMFLCQNTGEDMWHLSSLIDQLVAYVASQTSPCPPLCEGEVATISLASAEERAVGEVSPSRLITIVDVQLFLDEKIDDNVFNMVEAIVGGNKKQAFKLLNEQRRLGEEDSKIFGLLVWQFRILLEMGDLIEREVGLTSDQIATKLKIHPFVAKKNLAAARRRSLAELQAIYQSLLDIDIKTKTGQGGQSFLIDLFVAK
ncbi:MAG: hypothetical protein EXS55_02290 [Candidatus Magasanikbacteria bacterium]|nr:hypothetical protein [Candidatus Magasanikbacteria bacterium]